jgi:hypothetical protein
MNAPDEYNEEFCSCAPWCWFLIAFGVIAGLATTIVACTAVIKGAIYLLGAMGVAV